MASNQLPMSGTYRASYLARLFEVVSHERQFDIDAALVRFVNGWLREQSSPRWREWAKEAEDRAWAAYQRETTRVR
jgi:hypothetical protein